MIKHYVFAAENLARQGVNPSSSIDTAKAFLCDCPPEKKEEYSIRLSLIMPFYYAHSGDVRACMGELIKLTSNPESGVPKEAIDVVYNYANRKHALKEAESECDPKIRDIWFDEAKHYSDTRLDKIFIELKRHKFI